MSTVYAQVGPIFTQKQATGGQIMSLISSIFVFQKMLAKGIQAKIQASLVTVTLATKAYSEANAKTDTQERQAILVENACQFILMD